MKKLSREIHQKMVQAAENMEFEKAAEYRDQIRAIENDHDKTENDEHRSS